MNRLLKLILACIGFYAGATLLLVIAAIVNYDPAPVPCYDFMGASANVIVMFNKCTGNVELRVLGGTKPELPPPAPQSFAGPKVGA